MKKQNVNNKLAFGKATVTELNSTELINVNAGTGNNTLGCFLCIRSSNGAGNIELYNEYFK